MKTVLAASVFAALLADCGAKAMADELWKCTPPGAQSPTFTDTPAFGPEVPCEKVETIRFTKSDNGKNSSKPNIQRSSGRGSGSGNARLLEKARSKAKAKKKRPD